MSAIEALQLDAAYVAVAKALDLPCQSYMALSDGPILDAQAGAETFGSALIAALAGVNSVSGPGMLDFLLVFNLPKLVFDDEMCGQALRFVREIEPKDDLPTDDLIRTLMADQHLIMAEHTSAHWPEELYLPSAIVDRDNREQWTKLGAKDTYQRVDRRRRAAAGVVPRARDRPAASTRSCAGSSSRASRTRPSCRSSPRPRSRPRRRSPPPPDRPGGATRDVAADAVTTASAADAADRPRPLRPVDPAARRSCCARRALAHDIATLADVLPRVRHLVRAARQDHDGAGDLPPAGGGRRLGHHRRAPVAGRGRARGRRRADPHRQRGRRRRRPRLDRRRPRRRRARAAGPRRLGGRRRADGRAAGGSPAAAPGPGRHRDGRRADRASGRPTRRRPSRRRSRPPIRSSWRGSRSTKASSAARRWRRGRTPSGR